MLHPVGRGILLNFWPASGGQTFIITVTYMVGPASRLCGNTIFTMQSSA